MVVCLTYYFTAAESDLLYYERIIIWDKILEDSRAGSRPDASGKNIIFNGKTESGKIAALKRRKFSRIHECIAAVPYECVFAHDCDTNPMSITLLQLLQSHNPLHIKQFKLPASN
jgi:hypothetical protein